MKWVYPDWVAILCVGGVLFELGFVCLAKPISKGAALAVLCLCFVQAAATSLNIIGNTVLSPSKGYADFGGSMPRLGWLEPLIVFLVFWTTILTLAISVPVTLVNVGRKRWRPKA